MLRFDLLKLGVVVVFMGLFALLEIWVWGLVEIWVWGFCYLLEIEYGEEHQEKHKEHEHVILKK